MRVSAGATGKIVPFDPVTNAKTFVASTSGTVLAQQQNKLVLPAMGDHAKATLGGKHLAAFT